MVNVLTSSTVNRGFERTRSSKKKTINWYVLLGSFSAKHTELRRKSKNWLARNQDNVAG